jgi:hypothetical protein
MISPSKLPVWPDCGRRRLGDEQIRSMTVDELNAAARCYRHDLRPTHADMARAAHIWNTRNASTRASVHTVDGFPTLVVTDAQGVRL